MPLRLRIAMLLALCSCIRLSMAQTAVDATDVAESDVAQPMQARRPDEHRPEQPIAVDLFRRATVLGLSYEGSAERRSNFDLHAGEKRDQRVFDQELELDAQMRASDSVTLFAQIVFTDERRKRLADGTVRAIHALARGQSWALLDRAFGMPVSLQFGRLPLIERRSWWWDEDLDALKLVSTSGSLQIETGLAHEVAKVSSADLGIDPAARGLTRWFGRATHSWAKRHAVEFFWLRALDRSGVHVKDSTLREEDADPSDAQLYWMGLRAVGEARVASGHRLRYWLDTAIVRGRETLTTYTDAAESGQVVAGISKGQRVRGHALNLGVSWVLPGAWRPTLTLGGAFGSGGTADVALDRNFRQTGLQENKGRIAGVKRVRYYGALLDPELSNLRIGTLGLGLRFLSKSSAELLLHHYRQQVASNLLAGSRLSEDPEGVSRDIGRELDLFVALREWRHAELTLTLSRFLPGAAFAFDRRDSARYAELGATFTF
ncbi:MAG: alginate export family protein [Burkholderiaceae bacterium]|nr:alginate export family protein [Burkholderiaceae bacterium]MDH3459721.1 alginate export family protein [Burkholderiaceae bacterium]